MIKSDIKIALYNDFLNVFTSLSSSQQLKGARSFLSITKRSMLKDYKKALRQIDKKVKVFVELPTYKSVGDGMVKEVFDGEQKKTTNDLVVVEDFPPQTTS